MRQSLRDGPGSIASLKLIERLYRESSLPQTVSRLFFVLYAPMETRVLVTRSLAAGKWSFAAVFDRLLRHPRRQALVSSDFSLQMDFVEQAPELINLFQVGMQQQGRRHFEIGLDGVHFCGEDGNHHFFLPGDAYVRSIMGMQQLRAYLSASHEEDYLRRAAFQRFRSISILVKEDAAYRLYRGIPVVGSLQKEKMEQTVERAIAHIQLTQEANGKFLYYYDPARDSRKDFEHPNRDLAANPYYNILRHSGGGLVCIYHEKHTKAGNTLDNIRRAIDYLMSSARHYELEGRDAAYIYSEKKAKLGGAGIGLYLVAEYQLLTGDSRYRKFADALAWHTLHQVTDSGEFIYYNIYLDKEVSEEDNHRYFSFYYPGEALCGLAKYLHLLPPRERGVFFGGMQRAMDYLLQVRPVERSQEYTEIPSDSWLMMAVMEMWEFPELRDSTYAGFVFDDAHKMVRQMYKVDDAPYPDYAGAFYYQYGDYPYSDGARMEGLLGAWELAEKMGETGVMRSLWPALKLGAWSLMHLVNTPTAVYSAKNPQMAVGGIRFKYTRQWFRIDTIQHVACFYAKLLPHWDKENTGNRSNY